MADIVAARTPARASLVGKEGCWQLSLPAGVAITQLQAVAIDPTTGRWVLADASTGAANHAYGIALHDAAIGFGLTAVHRGRIDGYDLDALDYDDPVFLSDTAGALADAAGTVSVVAGRVIPGWSQAVGSTPDRILEVDFR